MKRNNTDQREPNAFHKKKKIEHKNLTFTAASIRLDFSLSFYINLQKSSIWFRR